MQLSGADEISVEEMFFSLLFMMKGFFLHIVVNNNYSGNRILCALHLALALVTFLFSSSFTEVVVCTWYFRAPVFQLNTEVTFFVTGHTNLSECSELWV